MTGDAELEQAQECFRRGVWSEAHRLFSLTYQRSGLDAEHLEQSATSAFMVGRDVDFNRFLERGHQAHLEKGDRRRAARSAFWLGFMLMLRGESAQANGWMARAHRLVDNDDCVERGYLLIPLAEQRLEERDSDVAFTTARAAAEIGERFRNADLIACARHQEGRALIQQGHIIDGLSILDEVMIAVSRDELSPIVTGLMYCSVIDACQQIFALSRAHEWTFALTRWCEQQPEMVAFSGVCLLNRAEVLQFRGAWDDAMTETTHAYERMLQAGPRRQPAPALYRRGEIHRLRGESKAAEEAYRNANRLGAEPQPGLALLRLAQGRIDPAAAAIRRVLSSATDPLHRARLLPAYVEIALAAGDTHEARTASAELDEIAQRYATDLLLAMSAQARGAVELAEGRTDSALRSLRKALELWQKDEVPYETARVRVLMGQACRELGDMEAADLEFTTAMTVFEELSATPDLIRLDSIRKRATETGRHPLTPRELQILRQIASGKTNRAIANELVISERTIDRHVSNILMKLGVPTRAAATAYAYSHGLI